MHDVAMGFLAIGKGLTSNTSGAVDLSRYSEHVPGKNLLIQLSIASQFFTLHEFVELYADSFHVELESEKQWPVDPLIRY